MKKSSLFIFLVPYFPVFALDIKVSDQYPILLELNGTIEKISFGNGDKEYVSKEGGRFLEVKAKHPKTGKTTITVFYLSNEGKKMKRLMYFMEPLVMMQAYSQCMILPSIKLSR
ncbi:MAG: hypothetical protein NMK33_01320 [Candidatus Cardinium sp.]|uniref:hypothetical protein n=1 Tax=Cardinium endosymbiont of Dermatophagoides farinae TaxID=2597823 RepID=UPI0011830F3C|nr:hypothetical protein [Cardinium endosymbiont of Dermatophagoides farinae]TSJ81145.1 hypothetical protein FPG78_04000 [Cardinium endosymbiont of Dermatophagoides farinae]UWW97192.1 MAG: hypothetical protein NMK33_01320 [Candidatus Cardinium sp.]